MSRAASMIRSRCKPQREAEKITIPQLHQDMKSFLNPRQGHVEGGSQGTAILLVPHKKLWCQGCNLQNDLSLLSDDSRYGYLLLSIRRPNNEQLDSTPCHRRKDQLFP